MKKARAGDRSERSTGDVVAHGHGHDDLSRNRDPLTHGFSGSRDKSVFAALGPDTANHRRADVGRAKSHRREVLLVLESVTLLPKIAKPPATSGKAKGSRSPTR